MLKHCCILYFKKFLYGKKNKVLTEKNLENSLSMAPLLSPLTFSSCDLISLEALPLSIGGVPSDMECSVKSTRNVGFTKSIIYSYLAISIYLYRIYLLFCKVYFKC